VFQNDFYDYCMAAKEVASETSTLLIDVQTMQLNYMNSIGYDASLALYMTNDVLHYNNTGAYQVARIISEGVQQLGIIFRILLLILLMQHHQKMEVHICF
jgi:hypothetical protein